jgi:hypothetical protein
LTLQGTRDLRFLKFFFLGNENAELGEFKVAADGHCSIDVWQTENGKHSF